MKFGNSLIALIALAYTVEGGGRRQPSKRRTRNLARSNNEDDVKVYSTPNGEVIEAGNVKVTVANDGKETIEIASHKPSNNKPMGKGGDSRDDDDDYDFCGYYSFDVDCTHTNDGGADRRSTTDTITAKIYQYNLWTTGRDTYTLVETKTYNGFCQGAGKETIRVSEEECDVEKLILSTDGESAMLVDTVKLYFDDDDDGNDGNDELIAEWGDENGDAWCLSQDPEDNQSHWGSDGGADFLVDDQCFESLTFAIESEVL